MRTPDAREADVEAIKRVVAAVEHSQVNELPDEFAALFRSDAIWTTAHGRRLTGREEISAFTRRVLPGAMEDRTVTYEVEHVLFIHPEVAAVKVRQRYRTLDGDPVEAGGEGSPLYVMAKERGRWRLAAGQNTLVRDA